MNTPPAGYHILDVRNPTKGAVKLSDHRSLDRSSHQNKPPSPPAAGDHGSTDVFGDSDLAELIVDALNKPESSKSIPTFVLYDKRGLQLFDEITYADDYYLTRAEMEILEQHADSLVSRLNDESVIIELGAGSLRKTSIILNAIERQKKKVTYYALDLDEHELDRSLRSLGVFEHITLIGLLGTFDQGIPWISKQDFSNSTQKIFLYLGSSIGNFSRYESVLFLRRIQQTCMNPGDLFLIGLDKRKNAMSVKRAYDDSQGITREFIMNGLDHVNSIVGQPLLDRSQFSYDSRYQPGIGRHVAHYKALKEIIVTYRYPDGETIQIPIEQGELIHVEYSYKYSDQEIHQMLVAAELDKVDEWEWRQGLYTMVLAEHRQCPFSSAITSVHETLFPRPQATDAIDCDTCNADYAERQDSFLGPRTWPRSVPSKYEWRQLWNAWDLVSKRMINHDTMLFERPIALRHPFIFYLGHIPAFIDIQMSRNKADQGIFPGSGLTEPAVYADIFERGIDPDMEDPTIVNPHSEVPEEDNDWPTVGAILEYQDKIRARLLNLLSFWETQDASSLWSRVGHEARVTWMCYEHEAMHLETLLYMLVQSPNVLPPQRCITWMEGSPKQQCLAPAAMLPMMGGLVTLGHDDPEDAVDCGSSNGFGWDNEHPRRTVMVESFEIQTRPVTNGEYLKFLKETKQEASLPASWGHMPGTPGQLAVKTVYGLCPIDRALHWPAQVSLIEARRYADHYNLRIPTEPELIHFRATASSAKNYRKKEPNIGFKSWHPTDVSNHEIHVLGDVWEWTETIWDRHEGFVPSKLYPGYSADFFDGKHHVVLGGSWATVPRIAERISFRNWYQAAYPYVFAGFRCCTKKVCP
ncbi:hypothetical protein BX666DRAFT_766228 [Dichotomocladium elegans]|nr:hypothetical protein BX666DRAFT_766228 [Dichotomocladium elegans]